MSLGNASNVVPSGQAFHELLERHVLYYTS